MKDMNLSLAGLTDGAKHVLTRGAKYIVLLFLLLLIGVYGFVLFQIYTLQNVQPNSNDVAAQAQPYATPQVDPTVVKQMQALQDNNVSVKALFDQARNSPFQE